MCIQALSGALPCLGREQDQNREYFQSSRQHIEDQDDLGKRTEDRKITQGTYGVQAGTNVVEARHHGGKIRGNGELIQSHHQKADDQDYKINSKSQIFVCKVNYVILNIFYSSVKVFLPIKASKGESW